MSDSAYTHIFTDGLDKVPSASIWLSDYAKLDTFVYYTERKIKGYIATSDLEALAHEGLAFFRERKNIDELLKKSSKIKNQIDTLHGQIKENDSLENYTDLFIQSTKLLRAAYRLYFTNEEFMTSKLDAVLDMMVIEDGRYRLAFMETIIISTKDTHALASLIGYFHNVSSGDVEFLTANEIISLSQRKITPTEIAERKTAFFIQKDTHNKLEYFYGEDATQRYNNRIPKVVHIGNTLTGMGASRGIVTGKAYIVSLADPDLAIAIDQMPMGAILVSESTQPHLTIACHKAIGIITDEGGALSHAAIIARELKIPCVVGTKHATEVLENGQQVSIDGELGIVTML